MRLLKRLLGRDHPPKPRTRICIECGMPLAEHKEWCPILQHQIEMEARAAGRAVAPPSGDRGSIVG
jgi:hypothetical protein